MAGEIIIKNGKKYKKSNNGRIKEVCIADGCRNLMSYGKYGNHCRMHYYLNNKTEIDEERNHRKEENKNKQQLKYTPQVINGITIYIKDGIKFRKRGKIGRYDKICEYDNCTKFIQVDKYCKYHLLETTDDHTQINENINFYEKKIIDNGGTCRVIDNIKIYFLNNKKYRANHIGKLKIVCKYENCTKFARSDKKSDYCCTHINYDGNRFIGEKNGRTNNGKTNTEIGTYAEEWVSSMLKLFNNVRSIKQIGNDSNKLDIIYKINNDDEYKGIQIKTMSRNNTDSTYSFKISKKYHPDTLIVGVNLKNSKFVLFFAKDINSSGPTFSFNNPYAIYRKFMYVSITDFLINLEKMIPYTAFYDENAIPKDMIKERDSMNRLETKSIQLDLSFVKNNVKNVIDCTINNFNIQCKTTTRKNSLHYCCTVQKTGKKLMGKEDSNPILNKMISIFLLLKY